MSEELEKGLLLARCPICLMEHGKNPFIKMSDGYEVQIYESYVNPMTNKPRETLMTVYFCEPHFRVYVPEEAKA